jgi:hypothetical protein
MASAARSFAHRAIGIYRHGRPDGSMPVGIYTDWATQRQPRRVPENRPVGR